MTEQIHFNHIKTTYISDTFCKLIAKLEIHLKLIFSKNKEVCKYL